MILNKVKLCKYYNFVIYICFPVETGTLLQRRCGVAIWRRNNVVATPLRLLGLNSIVITSKKWDSLPLNGMKVPCYLVFSFLFFRLEQTVRKNTRMKTIFVTVMVVISKSTILKITWSQLCLKFFLSNNKAHCQTPYNWRFYGNGSTCVLILSWVNIMKQKSTKLFRKLSVAWKSEPVLRRTLHQDISLIIIFFSLSQKNLVFKFNLMLSE